MAEYHWTAYPLPSYVAALRVYEPLAGFPDGERERWQEYAGSGRAPATERGTALERHASLAALLGLPPACLPDVPDHAYVTEVDGVTLVCPWRTRVRAWAALADVRAELPEVLVEALVPASVVESAEQSLADWRSESTQHVHVLTSTWQVPVRWFVLFEPAERLVALGAGSSVGGAAVGGASGAGPEPGRPGEPRREVPAGTVPGSRSIVYRTAMSQARRRTARALAVLRRSGDGAATAGVEDLARWLEEFHPRALVELDYGGLVHLLDDEAMLADDSARDVADALRALGEGHGERAAQAYARVTGRMKTLQTVESSG